MNKAVSIASFNLLNLRLPGIPFYSNPGYSERDYKKKIRWTGALLDSLQASIVGVQEVFDEQALTDCVKQSKSLRTASVITAPLAGAANTLPRVGLISQLPLLAKVETLENIPDAAVVALPGAPEIGAPEIAHDRFSRPVLATTINLGTVAAPIPARLYVVHLKSRRPKRLQAETDPAQKEPIGEDMDNPRIEARAHLRALMMRAAEATGVRQLILRDLVNSRTPVIVMGDFNDHAKAMTTELITGRMYARRLDRRDYTLWHAAALQRPNSLKRGIGYTNIHLGEPGSIDHILLSEEFLKESRHAIADVVSVDWFNDHLNDKNPAYSDHGAIRASFRLKPGETALQAPAAKPRRAASRRKKS